MDFFPSILTVFQELFKKKKLRKFIHHPNWWLLKVFPHEATYSENTSFGIWVLILNQRRIVHLVIYLSIIFFTISVVIVSFIYLQVQEIKLVLSLLCVFFESCLRSYRFSCTFISVSCFSEKSHNLFQQRTILQPPTHLFSQYFPSRNFQ